MKNCRPMSDELNVIRTGAFSVLLSSIMWRLHEKGGRYHVVPAPPPRRRWSVKPPLAVFLIRQPDVIAHFADPVHAVRALRRHQEMEWTPPPE